MAGTLIEAAVLACIVAWSTTWGAAWVAQRLGVLDRPGGYKRHTAPTPLLGGLGVAAGSIAAVVIALPRTGRGDLVRLAALGLGALIIIVAGLIDDIRGLTPRYKFVWQAGAAGAGGVCLAAFGVHLDLFLHWPLLPITLLTALWIVAITNALNFLDNIDGLCAGLGAIGGCALAAINARQGEPIVALAAAALSGACIGFLPHNWPHARIFLGDTGSMLIGFVLAALSVMGVYTRVSPAPVLAVLTPLCVLGIPVLDALLVIILRARAGQPPWVGDRRHISHRLVRRGMHPVAAVATLWAAGAACGLAGVLLPTVGAGEAPLLFSLLLCALAALAAAAGTKGLS